jgi:hypothetical protein
MESSASLSTTVEPLPPAPAEGRGGQGLGVAGGAIMERQRMQRSDKSAAVKARRVAAASTGQHCERQGPRVLSPSHPDSPHIRSTPQGPLQMREWVRTFLLELRRLLRGRGRVLRWPRSRHGRRGAPSNPAACSDRQAPRRCGARATSERAGGDGRRQRAAARHRPGGRRPAREGCWRRRDG